MKKVFIDGKAGTTGLRIYERLAERKDISLILLSDEDRKNVVTRKNAINESDISFLCLPDDAARESVSLCENPETVIIDTSTAHRTEKGWLYGFPEVIDDFQCKVKNAKRIAVPGCHAGGFVALVKPLTDNGIIGKNARLSCFSLTGFSGGGKKMIAEYAQQKDNPIFIAPRQYGISQNHKHLKEMMSISGLNFPPVFCPIVGNFYSGMESTVSVFREDLENGFGINDIKTAYAKAFANGNVVKYSDKADEDGFLSAAAFSGKDSMEIAVFGNEERIILTARFDNLGKGASGAAIECLNYVLGVPPETGLNL